VILHNKKGLLMRKKAESIIEAKREDITMTQSRTDWGLVTGKTDYPKPTYFKNKKTGHLYSHISGGIGWPGNRVPGYALIVGVIKTEMPDPPFLVLDEEEDSNVVRLLRKCVSLRDKFGFWESSEILRHWIGDSDRYDPIVCTFSSKLRKKEGEGEGHGFYIYSPDDFDRPDFFEICIRQIQMCLTPNSSGRKRLYIGKNNKLRNHLQNFSKSIRKQSIEDHPAVFALGGVLHTLIQRKRWLNNSGAEAFNLDDF